MKTRATTTRDAKSVERRLRRQNPTTKILLAPRPTHTEVQLRVRVVWLFFSLLIWMYFLWQDTHSRSGLFEDEDEDEDDDEQGLQVRGKKTRARKFRNEDLPGLPASMSKWRDSFLPRWYYYISTVDNIWQLDHPTHVTIAQNIWDRKVSFEHTVALRNEPVFSLVS